jgi:hypothetical protein
MTTHVKARPQPVERQIGEFTIRQGNLCRVCLRAFKGRQRFDVRTYFEDADGEWRPTTKGVNLSVHELPELRRLVVDAERMAVEAGLIDPADFDEN